MISPGPVAGLAAYAGLGTRPLRGEVARAMASQALLAGVNALGAGGDGVVRRPGLVFLPVARRRDAEIVVDEDMPPIEASDDGKRPLAVCRAIQPRALPQAACVRPLHGRAMSAGFPGADERRVAALVTVGTHVGAQVGVACGASWPQDHAAGCE